MKLPKVGEYVKVDGWDSEFLVIDVEPETNWASLMPVSDGPFLTRIRADSLHDHHGPVKHA